MNVYFISGLAADKRVFKHICLPDHCVPQYIEWIPPEPGETLAAYSLRLAEQINTREPFILIGLSMGGMIAAEIARRFQPTQTILISSIPSAEDLPAYYKWAARIGIHKLLPVRLFKSAALAKRYFTNESKEDKQVLRQIIRESDSRFIRWAMDAVLKWDGQVAPSSYVHIHGTRDEILPLYFTRPTHIIPKAGHLMVMNRAGDINRILQELL